VAISEIESSSLERVRLEKINVQEIGARTSLQIPREAGVDLMG
jgi:hypothetical protein